MTAPLPLPDLPAKQIERKPSRLPHNSWISYSLAGLLMFSPLAFGAVEPWAIFILEAASAILLAVWTANFLKLDTPRIHWSPLFPPMIAFVGLLCIQLVPGVSAYWHATYSQFLRSVAYGMVCFLLVQTVTRNRQVRTIGTALTTFGVAVALFAVLQNLSSPTKLYWLRTPRFGGWIYGPYVNHNHYAGLMEMLAPIPLVYAFSRFAHRRKRWIAASAAAFMGATIFLSGSRGGMIAFACQIALLAFLIFREQQKKNAGLLLTAFLLILIGVAAWTGGREIKNRISTLAADQHSDLATDVRLQIDRDTLKMWWHRPLLGWGAGTFADVYPRFRSFYGDSLVNAAHNDFLQTLTETGIAGFAILIWFLFCTIRPAIHKSHKWQSNLNGAIAVSSLIGISGILVHSLFDFNLQIPANAALFYALCTVAAMDSRFNIHRRGHRMLAFESLAGSKASSNTEPVHP